MPVNPLKTHNFRLLAALLEGLLELLGGVGPWTFPNVQSTLWEGGVGPWTFQKVQPTLREGGVGPWTFRKVQPTLWEGVLDLGLKKRANPYRRGPGWYKVTLV